MNVKRVTLWGFGVVVGGLIGWFLLGEAVRDGVYGLSSDVLRWSKEYPVVLIGGIGLLPLVGVPVSPMYILGGAVYGVGMGSLLVGIGVTVNIVLGYWVARLFRQAIAASLAKRKYKIPELSKGSRRKVIVMTRLVPGLPLSVQNYILGVSGIPFKPYFVFSWPLQMLWGLMFLIAGESLFQRKVGLFFFGVSAIIVLLLLIKLLRNTYVKGREEKRLAEK